MSALGHEPRRRAALALALAIALAAGDGLAQPSPTPPPAAPPRPLTIAAPSETTLGNGLRVIVARRDGVPLVSAELVALTGAEADPPRLAGLASLSASLMTQGTRRHSAPQLAAAAETLGGSLDSAAGWNHALVSITVTTPKLDAALALVAEVTREPVFANDELERVRTQALDGLKVAYAEPSTLASIVAQRLAYGPGAYGHPASGTPDSLPRIVRADLVAAHRQAFRPDNAVLILAGDIDADAGLALARRHFGSWTAPATPLVKAPRAAADPSSPAAAIVDMTTAGQTGVVLALALPDRSDEERTVGAVLNAVLGGGYSSRLNQEIRIRRGLSYGVSSGIEARREAALLRVSVQTKNESAAEVVALIQAEIDRLMTQPVDAEELAARKTTLIGGFSRSVETTAGLAGAIRSLVVANRPAGELKTRIERIGAVGSADVQRYAAAQLGVSRRRIAVAGEAGSSGKALLATLPGAVTVREDALDVDRGESLSRR